MIVAEHEYHVIELHTITDNVIKWLCDNMESHRWFTRGNKVYFFNQKDHMMFLLRWS
jgi:hypothetical protein